MKVTHGIEPVYNEHSRVLILGTMPSPKSREQGFYYMHPQNRFWRVLSVVLGEELEGDADKKKAVLLKRGIALWDVLSSCDIKGAADSSIKNEQPNDLASIFDKACIKRVYTTGKTAQKLYKKYIDGECIALPSPSPANCAVHFEELVEAYSVILEDLTDERADKNAQ